MIRRRSTAMLLTVALIAQSMIAGLGHDHHEYDGHHGHTHVAHMHTGHGMHEHGNASVGHSHDHHSHVGHSHSHTHNGIAEQADGNESPRDHAPSPSHQDDCSVCRHLSLSAALTLELEAVAVGNAVATVTNTDSLLTSATTPGLHQPRAPPEFS